MSGSYRVRTNPMGQSALDVEATVTSPKPFRKTSNLGIGWGFSYGKKQEKTEVYMAMWSF
jgi:hypothetical protein